jgi:hypothetical protein
MPMIRKIFFGVAFFGLAILFANSVSAANIDIDYGAELNKACKPSHCIVPIPTLVNPNEKIIKIDENFYLTGLTWNNTRIDIYLDDQYQGEAIVINDDDSDIANFYYLIESSSLLEGQHKWEVIAWTKSMRKRSYVSVENKFTIETYFTAPYLNRISDDIDGNNWLIGVVDDNSIVNIYVDNVYQGQVRTEGNFNYNIGNLSPGLHTFYAIAQEIDTGQLSKRSNLLSKQIVTKNIDQSGEDMQDLEEVEVLIEESVELEEMVEIEEPIVDSENNISSISEEKGSEDQIDVQSKEEDGSVSIIEVDSDNVEVGVISQEESQDQLVVDNQKSVKELEEIEKEVTMAEKLQTAAPSDNDMDLLTAELSVIEKQERNRKVGLWLLIILIVIVIASSLFRKKVKPGILKETEDDTSKHQGNLFNKE